MPDVAQVLRDNGIVAVPADVIACAEAVKLPVSHIAAKLQRESYGGKNVFGNDRVAYPSSGPYTAATVQVTYEACQAYLTWRRAGKGRGNGVGPAQLTYFVLQEEAERRGGLHVPRINMIVGAEEWARCLKVGKGSIREAGARYNGGDAYADSTAAAKEYGRWMDAQIDTWNRLLSGAATYRPEPAAPASGRPTLRLGDEGPLVHAVQVFLNANFKAYSRIDLGPRRFGPQTAEAIQEFQRRSRIPDGGAPAIGKNTWAALEAAGFRYP